MIGARLLCLPACALVASGCVSDPPVILHFAGPPHGCAVALDGRPVAESELLAAARAWRGRSVYLQPRLGTPYKCIGAAIFTIQRAGVKRVTFTAPPPHE
jgi:hypothetical protein